jgi:transposase
MELAEARRARPRARSESHPALGPAHLAAIEKKAQNLKAAWVFVDESGFSLLPIPCKTWSPLGQTPALRHCFNWPMLSALSAVTPNPHVYLHLIPGTVKSPQVIRFVQHLLRSIPGTLFLFWDGFNPHRSARIRSALSLYRDGLRVYRLPAYAPELNPDEWLWAWLKQHAPRGLCPANLSQLQAGIRRAIRRHPQVIRSFFQVCPLSF